MEKVKVLTFVDTNVLIYRSDARDALKQARAHGWLAHLWETGSGRVSVQILQEYYNVATRKLRPARDRADVQAEIGELWQWRPVVVIDDVVLQKAWALEARHALSFWDALVVASAYVAGATQLLSEDFQDGQVFDGVRVVNPFVHAPEAVVGA